MSSSSSSTPPPPTNSSSSGGTKRTRANSDDEDQQHEEQKVARTTAEQTVASPQTQLGSLMELDSDVIMCMRTLQSGQWRTLVDALKDLCPEVPVKFDHEGMKLISMDVAHVVLIHVHAVSEFYYCKSQITIGLNVQALYKMLRSLTTSGYMLEFVLRASDDEHLFITITNNEKRTSIRHSLNLMQLGDTSISIEPTTFHRVLSLPATDFQRYVKELSSISDKIKIAYTGDRLVLSAEGDNGTTEIEIRPTPSGLVSRRALIVCYVC